MDREMPYDLLSPELQFKVQESTLEINSPTAYANYQAGLPAVPVEHGLFNEMIGTADGYRCIAEHDISSCIWLGVGLTPAKPLKWVKTGVGSLFNRLRRPASAVRHSDDLANRAARLPFCSFTGDTPILMADGTTAPISEIQPGDQVLTTDPETGQLSEQTVTATWVHEDTVIRLLLRGDDATDRSGGKTRFVTITTTPDHPFWNYTDQQWQPADTLDNGDTLRTTTSNNPPTVIGTQAHTPHQTTVYNLTTTNTHTYYVLADYTPVLVHNTCSIDELVGRIDAENLQMTETVANHLNDITRAGVPSRPFMNSTLTVQEIMRGSNPAPDPGGVQTALRWDTPGALNGRPGTWELVIDAGTNTILHFNFVTR